jgi:dTDP-glucose 4,6-dehydratase
MTNKALAQAILRLHGSGWDRVRYVPDRKVQDQRYSLDYCKIQDELGFEPQIPFADGLAATFRWYRDNPSWWAETPDEVDRLHLAEAVMAPVAG